MKIETFKSKFKNLSKEEQTTTIGEMVRLNAVEDYGDDFTDLINWCVKNKTK